jgi:hypothetical protein
MEVEFEVRRGSEIGGGKQKGMCTWEIEVGCDSGKWYFVVKCCNLKVIWKVETESGSKE